MPFGDDNEYDKKIAQLEMDIMGVKHILNSQETILREVKDVLIAHQKTFEQMSLITERVFNIQEKINSLQLDFNTTCEKNSIHTSTVKDFMSRCKGGIAVFLFMFSIVEGFMIWNTSQIQQSVEKNSVNISESQRTQIEDHERIKGLERQITVK